VAEDTSSEASAPRSADIRTFLIADVRGYTRYTREHGDEAASELAATLAEIVRSVVPQFHGDLFELRGDEAVSVFFSAREAIRAAVEVQRRLREQQDGEPAFPLGVGMGIDSGEVVPTEGGFRGGALNLAARLCAIAKPGQILASDHCAHLAGRVEGVRSVDRRPVRLKGIERPVRLVEVVPEIPLPAVPVVARRRGLRRRWLAVLGAMTIVALVAVVAGVSGGGRHAVRLRGDSVVALDPVRATVLGNSRVQSPATAVVWGHGSAWAAESGANRIERVYVHGGTVEITVGRDPSAVAFGFGTLWVANTGDGTVTRVGAVSNTRIGHPIKVGNGPDALAVTSEGVWVANQLDDTVVRINPSNRVGTPVSLSGAPTAMASLDGSIWVAEGSVGIVARIDARSGATLHSIAVPAGPVAIAAAAGRIWIANADGTVSSISPRSNNVVSTTTIGGSPAGIAGFGGSIWVANNGSNTLTELSATTGAVTNRLLVGTPTGVLASGGGQLWVSALPSAVGHRGGTLHVVAAALGGEVPDPGKVSDALGFGIVAITNDGLVGLRRAAGSAGYEVVPDLAASMPTIGDGGLTYTFQLRRGIRYSTGSTVTAADVRFTIERAYRIGSENAGYFFGSIRGAGACAIRPATCDLTRGISIDTASRTVTFHLTKPDPDFLAKLSVPSADILPAGTPADTSGHATVPATGPYMVKANDLSTLGAGHITLVRNPQFRVWSLAAQPPGYPNRIVIQTLGSSEQDVSAVERGHADWMVDQIPNDRLTEVLTRYAAQLHPAALDGTFYLVMDTRFEPFRNLLVRQAIAEAINRRQLLATAGGPQQATITCQLLPPSFPGYTPYCPYTRTPNPAGTWTGTNLTKARRLIKQSGTQGDAVAVWTVPGPPYQPAANRVATLLRSLGYHVMVHIPAHVHSFGEYYHLLGQPHRPPAISPAGWVADYPGAADFFLPLFTCHTDKLYCDPHLDHIVTTALHREVTNPIIANRLWAQADHYLIHQAAIIPLWTPAATNFVSRRVGNYQYTPASAGGPFLDQMWVR
jgi:ABC-type transport system substrate-binding protein/class 3 adenylate cyclase